jgi:transposase
LPGHNDPYHRNAIGWLGDRIMAFLNAHGMVTMTTRPTIAQRSCCDGVFTTCRILAQPDGLPL